MKNRTNVRLVKRMYVEDLGPERNVIDVHVAQVRRKFDPA